MSVALLCDSESGYHDANGTILAAAGMTKGFHWTASLNRHWAVHTWPIQVTKKLLCIQKGLQWSIHKWKRRLCH